MQKKKKRKVVSSASVNAEEEKMAICKIGTKKYEVAVDTGKRYENGRKIIKRERVDGTKKEAQMREKELLNELRDDLKEIKNTIAHIVPSQLKKSNETFEDVAERWIKTKQIYVANSTWKRYSGILNNHLLPFLGKKVMASISIEDIENYYIAKTKEEIKLSQHKVVIDGVFYYAARTKKIIIKEFADEIKNIRCPGWEEEEIECITDEEELAKMLLGLRSSVVFLPAYLAIATGARLSEIVALQWKDVDFIKNTVTIRKTNFHKKIGTEFVLKKKSTKNKNIRTVQISEKDTEVLRYFRDKQNGKGDHFVCLNSKRKPFKSSTLSSNFIGRMKVRGWNISFHSLRHSHGTMLAYHRATEKYILQRLGDRDPRMAKRYTRVLHHLEDPLAVAATEKVTKHISFDTTFDTNQGGKDKNAGKGGKGQKGTALSSDVEMGGYSISKPGAGKRT